MRSFLIRRHKKKTIITLLFVSLFAFSHQVLAEKIITAVKITTPPEIDGKSADEVWAGISEVKVRDDIAGIDISLKAAYNDSRIFFLVQFPDPDESRIHKPWVWDKDEEFYKVTNKRADSFVFKWSLSGLKVDLRLKSGQSHTADIWYWKANRTDPSGFADDKMHILSTKNCRKCTPIRQPDGQTLYLQRIGDKGKPAYAIELPEEYIGDEIGQYTPQRPTKSRADISARGTWKNGMWTIEFSRLLDTGHIDDIAFVPGQTYLFGVSRYEVAGKKPNPRLSQPLKNSGELTERLLLQFQ